MSDRLDNLPVDDNPLTSREMDVMKRVFDKNVGNACKFAFAVKDILIAGGLFVGLSIPLVDELVYRVVPAAKGSMYVNVAVKALIFMVILFVFTNFHLAKKG